MTLDPDYTPWGMIQHASSIGKDMSIVSTSSHGGLVLESEWAENQIRERLSERLGVRLSHAGVVYFCPNFLESWKYWEEDCDLPLAMFLLEDLLEYDVAEKMGFDFSSKRFKKWMDLTMASYMERLR